MKVHVVSRVHERCACSRRDANLLTPNRAFASNRMLDVEATTKMKRRRMMINSNPFGIDQVELNQTDFKVTLIRQDDIH